MTTDPTPRAPRRPARGFLLLWLLGRSAAALSVAWPLWPLWPTGEATRHSIQPPPTEIPFDAPGIRQPDVLPAAELAALGSDEPVIGVSAGGHDRAYLVRALSKGPKYHIVNDILGGVPVSVTYCNFFTCTRLFTGAGAGPLDLSQGGLKASGMVLKSGGHPYRQDSCAPLDAEAPPFPYDSYPGDVTTWGAWRRGHPDTDAYASDVPLSPPPPDESPSPDE